MPYLFLKDDLETKIVQKDHDIVAIKEIYEEYIKSLINLASDMNVKNPLDIYFLIYFMYDYGIFSYDKLDHYEVNSYLIEKEIMGPLALNGHGVCRHASVFLQKIYSLLGYDSSVMIGFFNSISNSKDTIKTKSHDEAKRYIEEYFSNRKNSIRDIEFQQDFRSIEISTGNHMVTSVNAEDKTYLFDITQHIAYTTLYPDILHIDWDYFFIPYKKIAEKKVKDKIYNITDDEETDEFIDELKNFRIDLQ